MKANHTAAALCCAALTMMTMPAHADCGPVIAAYAKAEATRRYAVYDVDRIDHAPKGAAFSVSIDGKSWVRQYDAKTGKLSDAYRSVGPMAAGEGDALKDREKRGKSRCEPLGDRKVGAVAATGYRIRDADAPDFAAIHFWVDRATGLPLFHGMGDDGGLRWAYGGDVVAPPASALSR